MIELSNEIKLAIVMMYAEDEVPDGMKTKCLEDLDILMMNYEESDAEFVITNMIRKAIKEDDRELLKKAAKYLASMDHLEDRDPVLVDEESKFLASVSADAALKFTKETDEAIRIQIIKVISQENLVPVHYEPGFLVLYNGVQHVLVGCSINGSYDKYQLADMTSNVSLETLEAIHKFSEEDTVKFKFAELIYKRRADDNFELRLEEF